jgi:hypothetical protein
MPVDSSSSDEINHFGSNTQKRDKPQLNERNNAAHATHAFDLDLDGRQNAVASSSRVHGDGPSTRMLQKDFEMPSHERRSSSPIEEYQEEQKPIGYVKATAKAFDDLDKESSSPPHLDLKKKSRMKPKMKPNQRVGKACRRNAVI